MVKRDLMRHIYCVCIGEANYLWIVLTNGFTAAEVTIGELACLDVVSTIYHAQWLQAMDQRAIGGAMDGASGGSGRNRRSDGCVTQ